MLAGLFRTLVTIVLVWFVFRWLDRMFGARGRRSATSEGRRSKPDGQSGKRATKDEHLGDYVDFEEIDD